MLKDFEVFSTTKALWKKPKTYFLVEREVLYLSAYLFFNWGSFCAQNFQRKKTQRNLQNEKIRFSPQLISVFLDKPPFLVK